MIHCNKEEERLALRIEELKKIILEKEKFRENTKFEREMLEIKRERHGELLFNRPIKGS